MSAYQDALDYIYGFVNFETRPPDAGHNFELGRVERLLGFLGNPHRRIPAVHIAGTKGKGSTAAMVESILRHAGYHTGLYTSPHLHTFRERIRVEGKMISESQFMEEVESIKPFAAQVRDLSTFEVATALAFSYFARRGVEIAVVEVGLGGRLDATNVIDPLVSVITPIGYDHSSLLGKKLDLIAFEKAGIIKSGHPVVCAPQRPAAIKIIRQVARERGAPLVLVEKEWHWERKVNDPTGQTFVLRDHVTYEDLWIPLLGQHQLQNAATAVSAIQELTRQVFPVSENQIAQGLAQVSWPGRLEIIDRNPLILVDAAHTSESAAAVAQAVQDSFPGRRVILIYGSLADKNHAAILRYLRRLSSRILLTKFPHPRSANLQQLESAAKGARFAVRWLIEDVPAAVEQALAVVEQGDLILALGSVAFVGSVRGYWFKKKGWPLEEDPPRPLGI